MADTNYLLLLNESLKNHILTLPQEKKKRLQEKFEFLENGIWDSGVKVKKLKGTARKIIFEARLSKGDRILFTLGKHDGKTAIYVWGIVKHDDISARAESILPANAPFLNFQEDNAEDYPEIIIDSLEPEYYTQENIEEKTLDDYGPQKWLLIDDKEWERILTVNKADNFEIFLFLTRNQQKILKNSPPVLLSGTAGSGKTTISVYYLLQKDFISKKRIFITYNSYLKRFSRQIYNGLLAGTKYAESIPEPDFFTFKDLLSSIFRMNNILYKAEEEVGLKEFETIFKNHSLYKKYDSELVWEEIRAIIKGAKPAISVNRYKTLLSHFLVKQLSSRDFLELKDYLIWLMNFELIRKVEKVLEKRTGYKSYDEFLQGLTPNPGSLKNDDIILLQEILKILEKKDNNFSRPLLTLQEYMLLGKKRAPNFIYNREDIYSIAEYYQNKLTELGLRDEIDNCRSAINHLNKADDNFFYDLVICDEVQDFSDIQLALIFKLARDYRNILLAGDTKQIINPSGFRWEGVKSQFYERGIKAPEVFNLNLNFRCVGNIVKLANTLLDLKQYLVGLSGSEFREDWKFNGKPPVLICDIKESELINELRLSSAGKIILVRDHAEQEKLKRKLNTELVFTINEAKGLEFDTVFLWKFCSDRKSADIWRRINNEHYLEESHYPFVKHEINLLYVAVTRARNTLIVYDGPTVSDVWNNEKLSANVFRTGEKASLTAIWNTLSTPEEWEKQGDYFFEREYYPAAFECYKNSNNLEKLTMTEAYIFEIKGEYRKAAERFKQWNSVERAAVNFEKAEAYTEALLLWELLKNKKRIQFCRIKSYEEQGEYEKAASAWLKLKSYDNALRNWEKGRNFSALGKYYLTGKKYKKAAEYFERAQDYPGMAACLAKAKEYNKAAELYFKTGDYAKAAALYKKAKNTARLMECYLKLKDHRSLAQLYETARDIDNAIEQYRLYLEQAPDQLESLRIEAEKYRQGKKLKAAILFSALGDYFVSAPLFLEKKIHRRALYEFRLLDDPVNTAECYVHLGDHYQAACAMENSGHERKWEISYSHFYTYIYKGGKYDHIKADKLFSEAKALCLEGRYQKALSRYKAILYPEGVIDCCLKLENDEEALHFFMERKLIDEAEKYMNQRGELNISFNFLKKEIFGFTHDYWYLWEKDTSKAVNLIFRIALDYLQHNYSDEARDFFLDASESIQSYYIYSGTAPQYFVELMFEIRNYNFFFNMLRPRRSPQREKAQEYLSGLTIQCRERAEKYQDKLFMAINSLVQDRFEFESLLEKEMPTTASVELFRYSTNSYKKAVEFYLKEGRFREAAITLSTHKQYYDEGQLWEKYEQFKEAADSYKKGKKYHDALRCYEKAENWINVAKINEKLGNYREAIKIWKKLGKKKELARLERMNILIDKNTDYSQDELF